MQALFNLSLFIFSGYTLTAIPLLLVYFFIKTKRPFLSRVMVCSNWILLTGSCIYLVSTLVYLIILLNNDDREAIYFGRLIGPYWFSFWALVMFKGIFPQILWFKKFRTNLRTTLVLLPFILFDSYYTFLIIWHLNRYREYLPDSPLYPYGDYLPSSRVWYGPSISETLIIALIYSSLVSVCYLMDKKRRSVEH